MNMRRLFYFSISIWFMLLTLVFLPYAVATEKPIVVGIFPRRNASLTFTLFKPMTEYLSRALGREVKLVTPKDFATFWKDVADKKFDLVHYNQYHYVESHQKYGYEVILKNSEFGKNTIRGSIIVRKDSGLKSISDLKGKKIVFGGGPRAMQSYITATYLLREGGLKKGDYLESFANNPPNALLSTYFKKTDAAGSGDVVLSLPNVKKMIKTEELTFLGRSEAYAHLPWAVKGDLSAALKNKIQSTLQGLKNSAEGKTVLKSAKLTGLEIAKDSEFDPHRKIIKAVTGESY